MRVYLLAALAAAVLGMVTWRVAVHLEHRALRALPRQRTEDRRRLASIARLVVTSARLPMKDGAFDPYDFVRTGEIGDTSLFQSARYGRGPTEEEAKAGDYSKFPWERYRGARRLGGPPFPLLWEKDPDLDGRMLVARSDGMVAVWDPDTFFRAVAELPIER
jgi:hypothetical protein